MKNKPIFWVSIDGTKFPYNEYLNIEVAGFQRWRNEYGELVKKWFEPLPKNLYPFTVDYEEKEKRNTLCDYSKTYSNFYFWVNNENIVLKLIWQDLGEDTITVEKTDINIKFNKKELNLYFDDLLLTYFDIKEKNNFIKVYNRFVRSYCEENKISDNDYPIPFEEMVKISNLEGYNINGIVECYLQNNSCDYDLFKLKEIELNIDVITNIVKENQTKFELYKKGQTGLINLFFGLYLNTLKDKNINKEMLMNQIKNFIDSY